MDSFISVITHAIIREGVRLAPNNSDYELAVKLSLFIGAFCANRHRFAPDYITPAELDWLIRGAIRARQRRREDRATSHAAYTYRLPTTDRAAALSRARALVRFPLTSGRAPRRQYIAG